MSAAGLLSSSLQGIATVTALNLQEKLADEYRQASEVGAGVIHCVFYLIIIVSDLSTIF